MQSYLSSPRLLLLAGLFLSQALFAAPLPNAWQIVDDSTSSGSTINYSTDLTSTQQHGATNSGFRFTVNARLVNNSVGSKTMAMAYGIGARRFLVWLFLDSNGDLNADVGISSIPILLTSDGTGSALYHTHEIILNASSTDLADYRVDGQTKAAWKGTPVPLPAGRVSWGASSSAGQGQMNVHSVNFKVTGLGLGTVAAYDAGTEGSPPVAPDPTTQGWSVTPPVAAPGTIGRPIAADSIGVLPNAWQITDNSIAAGSVLTYTTNLAFSLPKLITSNTFIYTLNARLLTNFGGSKTMAMGFGFGAERLLIWFNLDSNGELTAELEGAETLILTTNGSGSALYHTHEIIYNPTNRLATYRMDGQALKTNWAASGNSLGAAGTVYWGAGRSLGMGQMNFHSVRFELTNRLVASYDAGMVGDPELAPDPVTQGWTLDPSATVSTDAISPDITLLPLATTSPADQFTNDIARLNGEANPRGSPATAWFEWGTDLNYGNVTGMEGMGNGLSLSNISTVVNGLVNGTEYHFRLVASNSFGLAAGENQSFTRPGFVQTMIADLPQVDGGSVAWGDYDNDGRLDFLLTGSADGFVSQLWRNTGSGFSNVTASVAPGLPGVAFGSVAWGDYDNDGRLDFLLTGKTTSGSFVSQVWRNTGGGFSNVTANVAPLLPGVARGSVAWGDYDNDGRLDFLLTGSDGVTLRSQLWRNTGVGFSDVTASVAPGLPQVFYSSVAWGDYDNDGRLDFLLTGTTNISLNGLISQLWRNTGNGFSNVTASVAPGLPGVVWGSVAWGDYDNDGRLDFLLTGSIDLRNDEALSQIWRNTGSGFSNVTASVAPGLPGVEGSSVAWGDYDNDGRPDFLLTGTSDGTAGVSQLWRNTSSGFSNVTAGVAPGLAVYDNTVAWGDYDNDGRLDFLLAGTQLRRNILPVSSNAPPAAPTNLSLTSSGTTVSLNWQAPADDQPPAAGLSYNLRIGSAPGACDVLSPMAFSSGLRLLPALGNARAAAKEFRLPPGRTYYWGVQAVDASFAGSPFAPGQSFALVPQLINPDRLPGGLFEFHFINQTSLNFEILVSTDATLPVANWISLGPALPLGGGLYRFTDLGAIGQPKRFYLLRAL